MIEFPAHKCSLTLEHNPHRNYYDPISTWITERTEGDNPHFDWTSPEQKELARSTDNVWTLQWYPNTPVGFNSLCSSDLDDLLTTACRISKMSIADQKKEWEGR